MFQTIASFRDDGVRPEKTLEMIAAYKEVPLSSKKKAINLVYFDHAFEQARGQALNSAIFQTCVFGPPKPFEPLK